MSFEIIHEKKPSYSWGLMAAIVALSALLLGIGVAFAYLMISGEGTNYTLGILSSLIFLIAAIQVILFGKAFVPFREVSEDREEELLW